MARTLAAEGFSRANVQAFLWEKARRRLVPLGVEVIDVSETEAIPVADGSLDLILNRHSGWHFGEHLQKGELQIMRNLYPILKVRSKKDEGGRRGGA